MRNIEKLFIVKQGMLQALGRAVSRPAGLATGAALGGTAAGLTDPGQNWLKDLLFQDARAFSKQTEEPWEYDGGRYGSSFGGVYDYINRGIPGFNKDHEETDEYRTKDEKRKRDRYGAMDFQHVLNPHDSSQD